MIFNFALRPLNQVRPWGPERRLHWFGLTDGAYWISVGDSILFEYSAAIKQHWSRPTTDVFSRYADYQIARLWEDVWSLLHWALEPIPADIVPQRDFVERVWDFTNAGKGPDIVDPFYDLVETATNWWGLRQLDSSHLVASPKIFIWRRTDTMHIGWDTENCKVDGVRVWTAVTGTIQYPVEALKLELISFRDRLQAGMQERVDRIHGLGGLPGVTIDVERLVEEQRERFRGPDLSLERPMVTDWSAVRDALAELRRRLPEIAGDADYLEARFSPP